MPRGDDPLGIVRDGALAAADGAIVAVGATDQVLATTALSSDAVVVDASGRVAMPGLVDPHTHVVHAGSREDEFVRRLAGEDYLTILAEGGGILSTVGATRQASETDLFKSAMRRLGQMLVFGTTTAEVKSGYGLRLEDELKMLRVAARLRACQPIDVIPSFLGAHAVPPEFADRPDDYVDIICTEMIPRVADDGLAEFCDVFCERGVFTVEQSRRVLVVGGAYGLKPRLHADELADSGAADLAASLGAISADHLTCASPQGLRRLGSAGVIAVLLPGTSFFLDHPYAPARAMLDEYGIRVALATDCNPGTSPLFSMLTIISLACVKMRISVAEAIVAATRVAAEVLGRGDSIGTLEVGKRADVVVLDLDNHRQLVCAMGSNPVWMVVKGGRVVVEADSAKIGCDHDEENR